MKKRILLASVLAVVIGGAVGATDRHVSPSGSDANDCLTITTPCATIQHAVDIAAPAGDRVVVAAGTYIENVTIAKDIIIDGEPGSIVDGNAAGTVFTIDNAPAVTFRDMEIRNGLDPLKGGGISTTGGTLNVVNCTLEGNRSAALGGGLLTWLATATVTSSTFRNNDADQGGGIYVVSGDLILDNSTLSGNSAMSDGGGLVLRSGTASVNSATIADNAALGNGGGIHVRGGTLTLRNTILDRNQAGGQPGDCSGDLASLGHLLISTSAGCNLTADPTDLLDVRALLGPLADNGGLTPTHALLAGSPALDAGNPASCVDGAGGVLTRDQRGQLRNTDCGQGPRCDIGALESTACRVIDVTSPAEVRGVLASRATNDAVLSWDPVVADLFGQPESIDHYRVYRDLSPDFVPDRSSFSNLAGTSLTTDFFDTGAIPDGRSWYYLVSAVDAAGNERQTARSVIFTLPVLAGVVNGSAIDLSWTGAEPAAEVASYRVYAGTQPGLYSQAHDAGLMTSFSLAGLTPNLTWYMAIGAIDRKGNESARSNEIAERITASTVTLPVLTGGHTCWLGRGPCSPSLGVVQRDEGRELLVPVTFPEGAWTKVEVKITLNSYATSGRCAWPNPTGDIYDRLFTVFMVDDEACLAGTGKCWGAGQQLELLHGVTPFGTDGRTGPRVYTIDVTPFAPLFTGTRYIGHNMNTWDGAGWWADIEMYFSELPGEASPKLPASGFELVHFEDDSPVSVPRQVTIPAQATNVKMRLFVSGHGGANSPSCPNPADEFCPKDTRILVDSNPVWTDVPWRDDCSPAGNPCNNWNACGFPSCTYPRSAWCPGYITCHDNDPCDQDLDATTWLPAGETHDVQYEIVDFTPGSWWAYSLVVYWYE